MRVFPIPGSPTSSTTPPRPARASSSRRAESPQLRRPPRERRVAQQRRARVAGGTHLVRRHGLGEALQLQRADRRELERLPAAQQLDHHAAAEDLPRRRPVAEPPRHHHRRADVVRLVRQHLADVQPDP